jgi:hypothetical protein
MLQVRLSLLRNDVVNDVLSLFIWQVLLGLKWWELIKIVVDFDPPGAKLTDHPVTALSEGTHGCAHTFSVFKKWIVFREYMFCNGAETMNMSVPHLFFLFCCLVVEDTKSLTLIK